MQIQSETYLIYEFLKSFYVSLLGATMVSLKWKGKDPVPPTIFGGKKLPLKILFRQHYQQHYQWQLTFVVKNWKGCIKILSQGNNFRVTLLNHTYDLRPKYWHHTALLQLWINKDMEPPVKWNVIKAEVKDKHRSGRLQV